MSLVTRQLAPVLDQLDRESLPNSPQIYIIGSLSIRGHTYGPSTISTREAHLGDYNRAVMCKLLVYSLGIQLLWSRYYYGSTR